MSTKCLECKEVLSGRSDKKFCSDYCRSAHHNRKNADTNNFMRNINNILRKNRRIMKSMIVGETAKVTKTDLLDEGFKFRYYTNEYTTKTGKVYKFCYEYGYLDIGKGKYALVKRKEYVE